MRKNAVAAFLLTWCAFSGALSGAAETTGNDPYCKDARVECKSKLDRLLFDDWKREDIPVPREGSDAVLLRRLYLDLAGRLPTLAEAEAYLAGDAPDKYEKLLDRLLESEDFVNYRGMLFCDMLRVKSEFPINLWPNAVQAYARRIRSFLSENESCESFFSALLLSGGSNFRESEVNFYRACAAKTGEGIARNVTLTLLGMRYEKLPEAQKKSLAELFSRVKFKSTKEWKEEIVYQLPLEEDTDFDLPGRHVRGRRGELPGEVFRRYLFDPVNPLFCRAVANRVWQSFFGRGILDPADDLPPGGDASDPELLKYLAGYFADSGYDLRKLIRVIALSASYRAASVGGVPEEREKAERHFAVFPVRRIPGEALDDIICDISGDRRKYASVIPEPFSFFPGDERTVLLDDGSVSNAFLLLFGRPSRDAGTLEERVDRINAKQRQYLFNSGELNRRCMLASRREDLRGIGGGERIRRLYLIFYSRPPTAKESRELSQLSSDYRKKKSKRFFHDLIWSLFNSSEFIYQH